MPRLKSEFQVGAIIRIVTPQFFIRCGYPMSYRKETARIIRERTPEIAEFMRSMGVAWNLNDLWGGQPLGVNKIAAALAYDLCKQKRFGGSERKIYTIDLPEAAGEITTISKVQFVRTGNYVAGSTMYDSWGGGYEYDPPYLEDSVSHRILSTNIATQKYTDMSEMEDPYAYVLKIEAKNVELVKDEH